MSDNELNDSNGSFFPNLENCRMNDKQAEDFKGNATFHRVENSYGVCEVYLHDDGRCLITSVKENVELWRWRVSDIASSDWFSSASF